MRLLSGGGETNPYGGQADAEFPDRARRLRETSEVTDLASRGPYSPSQRGPATGVGIRITSPLSALDILVRETINGRSLHVFETIAFLSTVGFFVIFVALIQMNRSSQNEEK
jgi:hypothetical protein